MARKDVPWWHPDFDESLHNVAEEAHEAGLIAGFDAGFHKPARKTRVPQEYKRRRFWHQTYIQARATGYQDGLEAAGR